MCQPENATTFSIFFLAGSLALVIDTNGSEIFVRFCKSEGKGIPNGMVHPGGLCAGYLHISFASNRPFYRYGGHIELIRFMEYYRMPRGHEHISFVFSSAFRDIFSSSFLRIRL